MDGVFFLTARADRNEAVLALGPRDLMIDLPIRVQGLENNGCARVADAAALVATLDRWLTDPVAAAQQGKQAQQFIRRQQGATRRNVEMICKVLNRTPAATPCGIATDKIAQPNRTRQKRS